jgi:hypothetical protein
MAPIRFGNYVAKCRAKPAGDRHDSYLELIKRLGSQTDAMRLALEETLRTQEVLFEFQVQLRTSEATMPVEDAMVWRVADELLYTRRVTDATYKEALAVLGERRLLSSATIAAYYEYVSMLLNMDRYPLPADAPQEAAQAAQALSKLTAAALYRPPAGPVTPRSAIPNEDTERAIAALGASVNRDEEVPRAARDAVRGAVLRQWNRTAPAPDDSVAYRFATELLATREVADATFAAALEAFGERRLVNLMVLMGHSNIRCAQLALAGADCVL